MARVPLNLFDNHRGRPSRQRVTCRYKCGDACFHPVSNTSDNAYFGDIVRQAAVSRRSMLQAAGITVLAVGTGSALVACSRGEQPAATPTTTTAAPAETPPGMNFASVANNTEDAVVIPDGYQQAVVIRWGDPVLPDAPEFDVNAQTAAGQRLQFGFNNDFAGLLPIPGSNNRFLLVVAHEYTTEQFMFFGYNADEPTREQFEVAIAAHGMTVLEVERGPNGLVPMMGRYNRRITADTPMTLIGPAAASEFVRTAADPDGRTVAGTLNNCAGGLTPWGTVLSAEENFNQYFGAPEGAPAPGPVALDRLDRYGVELAASERKWERFDPRFDLAATPNEPNRYGYIVEINPWDPASTPVKHTALGRTKHEAATIYVTDDGTVVTYSGDDERFEYLYKFVSSKKIQPGADPAAITANMTILDEGTMYVARFSSDIAATEIDGTGTLPSSGSFSGGGTWIPILRTGPGGAAESLVDGMTPQEVAVFTRFAGDQAGATKMDRPEDCEPNPQTGKIYAIMTNNDERGLPGEPPADAVNPRNENLNGHIIEIIDNHAGTDFTWNLLLVCGDPGAADSYFAGFDKDRVSPISCPDNLAFDSHGNMWVATDGGQSHPLETNDGLFAVAVEGPNRGETRQFLTVPIAAETCGPVVTDDLITVCVQHPGERDENSLEDPISHWPEGGDSVARPAVVAVWKPGGRIGV